MSVIILFCLSFLLVEYISWHFKGEKGAEKYTNRHVFSSAVYILWI